MAFNQSHPHNVATCPEVVANTMAERAADRARQRNEATAKENRGVTQYLNLELEDLPTSAELMSGIHPEADTFFVSSLEAKAYRQRLLALSDDADATIPQTEDDRRSHVKTLYMAFKCLPDECGESEAIKKPFIGQIHDNYLLECLCWDILEACIRRSQVVCNLVESYEPEKYKFKKGKGLSFRDRFDSLVRGMAVSKSMCKHIFDAPYLFKVVDDPQTNVERIESNRKLNGQKAQVMKRGKEAVAGDDTQQQSKRPRTERAVADRSNILPTEPLRTQHMSAATQSPPYTPTRRLFSGQQPRSAPPAPPVMVAPMPAYQSHAQPGNIMHFNGNSNMFSVTPTLAPTLTPTRAPNMTQYMNQSMSHGVIFGSNQHPSYPTGYGQAYIDPQYTMQALTQMTHPGYATPSNVRTRPALPSSAPTSYVPPRSLSQYPDPQTPDRVMTGNWLAGPQPEMRTASNSGYTSAASTMSASQGGTLSSQLSSPQDYKPAGHLCDTSSNNTQVREDEFDSTTQHTHLDLNEFIQGAELDQENEAPAEEEDAAYETEG